VLLPAEIVPGSAVPDPSGRWLALVAHATSGPGGRDALNLCVLELRPGGVFRNIADLGNATPAGAALPVAWSPAGEGLPSRLLFVGTAPAAASSSGGGLFGISGMFNALRPAAPPSGLFIVDLEKTSGFADSQPRRLGTAVNNFGPVWRSDSTLYGFARQGDGTLALHSIDPASGLVQDLGVRLPGTIAQGMSNLSARWDARHGNALLLGSAATGGTFELGAGPLQAWLVSFVLSGSPSAAAP
jgi:hypothetical protein